MLGRRGHRARTVQSSPLPDGAAQGVHCAALPPTTPSPRASILEMRKDHEEQLQRLKLLKDREIDAVTSATSHTR